LLVLSLPQALAAEVGYDAADGPYLEGLFFRLQVR
jgi:hypothetical protein